MQTRRFLFPTFRISCQASDTSEEELTEADAKARRPATRRCATRRSRASASKNGAADATFPLAVCVGPTMLETRYSVGSGATGTKARETRERADSSSKSNGSIPSNTTLACTCYAHLVTCSAKTQTNFRRDLHPFFFAPCFRFHPLFFSFSCVSFPLLPSTIYLILAIFIRVEGGATKLQPTRSKATLFSFSCISFPLLPSAIYLILASIFALFSFTVIILAEGGATKLRTTRSTTFEGYPFFFLLYIIPPSPLHDLFNSREYFRAIFICGDNTCGGWGYETTNYTLDHVRRLPQMGSMSRHCDPLQATEMHRLTPLSARLLSSLHSSMLLGPSSSLYLPISLSLSLRRTWIFLFVPLVPRSPLPTAALAPSINAYVRDTMYPAVL